MLFVKPQVAIARRGDESKFVQLLQLRMYFLDMSEQAAKWELRKIKAHRAIRKLRPLVHLQIHRFILLYCAAHLRASVRKMTQKLQISEETYPGAEICALLAVYASATSAGRLKRASSQSTCNLSLLPLLLWLTCRICELIPTSHSEFRVFACWVDPVAFSCGFKNSASDGGPLRPVM